MLAFKKTNQTPSHLYSDEEKAEIRSIASFESKYSNKRNIYNGHQYIAISPDGTQIVTLNTTTYQLKLCQSDNISTLNTLNYNSFKNFDTPAVIWSLAISNEITLPDRTTDVLIAVSCFDDDVNNADSTIKHTWVISSAKQARISSSINDMGGIIKFLDDDSSVSEKTDLALINSYGISRFSIHHDKINSMINENYVQGWFGLFSDKSVENFNLPSKLLNNEISSFSIQQNLVKGRFLVESYKNKRQTVEMYNLKTSLLENTFQKSEETAASISGRGYSCYAISNNESLFAYCRGANSITIYLMENGLEVTTKKFNETNIQILFFDFVKNDEKLLIVIEKESYNEETSELVKTLNISNSSSSTAVTTNTTMNYHSIYDSYGKYLGSKFENRIIRNPEPWILNKNYECTSVYLDDNKSIQLFIGGSTVQVWRKRKSGTSTTSSTKVLEYIWTNNFNRPMQIQSLEVGHKEFSLTLYIPSINSLSELGDTVTLEWPEKVNPSVHACEALEFFNEKKDQPLDPKRQHQFDELIQQTERIIRKYLTKRCGLWRMLDIRYDIMANLIRGNCTYIIRNILFSISDRKNNYLHIPRCNSWGGQLVKDTDLEISIACTKGGYRKDTIIVKYLLDYYSNNALESSNWMFTVAKAIPILYEYNLEFYVEELFQKPCFGASEVYLDQSKIRDKDMDRSNEKDVHALNVNLGLTKKRKEQKIISDLVSKTTAPNSSLINQVYMVPLPDFTVYPEKVFEDKRVENWKIPFKFLKLLFWPRGHVLRKKHHMSPFLRMIREDNAAQIYDNPSMAAVIDFKWKAARNYFLRHALIYVVFAFLFAIITNAIKGISERISSASWLALVLYFLFYWFGFYLLNTERIQLKYEGWRRYFGLYNFFDLFSVILPLVIASLSLYIGFKVVLDFDEESQEQIEEIIRDVRIYTIFNSFAILVMWLELFLLLRYFEKSGAYIYIIVNIFKQIIPFLIFILMVVLGFGHAMFVLLNNTESIGIKPDGSSFQITPTDSNTSEPLPYKVEQVIDVNSISDNYYTNFIKSVESVFFWTSGRWDQLEQWNFWPVDVYSIIGSILLVTILQNMLIAIMTGAYDDAKEIGRHAVLEYRAELIEDYETIEKPLGSKRGNPRYIYYIGKSDYIEECLTNELD
ncbi:22959_t:CDS:2, partial [Rhizophagus irregularis]